MQQVIKQVLDDFESKEIIIEGNFTATPHSGIDSNQRRFDAFYEKAETDQLKAALKRSYKERFTVMTGLMKMNIMFSRAKIITKNSNSPQA